MGKGYETREGRYGREKIGNIEKGMMQTRKYRG